MKDLDYSKPSIQLMFSTVKIECVHEDGNIGYGTGFFYSSENNRMYLVTNKHVVKGGAELRFNVHEGEGPNDKARPSGESHISRIQNVKIGTYHPDDDIDLCVFHTDIAIVADKLLNPYIKSISHENIPDDKRIKTLGNSERVLMVGYPIGLSDSHNNLPIFRRGTTATHPGINFEGQPKFVIDMACFPGSSGSPVSILDEGVYSEGESLKKGTRFMFLGILDSGPLMSANGEIKVKSIPTSYDLEVSTNVMINLGYVIKSSVLKKFIQDIEKGIN